jgi:polygalacturonase
MRVDLVVLTTSLSCSVFAGAQSNGISSTEASSLAASTGAGCTCTQYSQIAPAVASCNVITLQDIAALTNSSIDLSALQPNTVVTFAGLTTFTFTNSSSFNPIIIGDENVTITSAPGAVVDGNGQAYWDGLGSNGGVPK